MTVVPFYFYAPDVYQGASSPVTGLLGFIPKMAGFIAILRIISWIGFSSPEWKSFWAILWGIALATTTAGNTLALWQNDVKRLLAYSSIAHSGIILMGLLALRSSADDVSMIAAPVLFYLVIYALMSIGSFGLIGYLSYLQQGNSPSDEKTNLNDFEGLSARHPTLSCIMAIFLLSLTGLPPTAGFWAKFYIFALLLRSADFWLILLAVLGLLNSAIAAAYYFRILSAMYLHKSEKIPASDTEIVNPRFSLLISTGIFLSSAAILVIGIVPSKLFTFCLFAAKSLTKN
jgi:NADH-quinone oxidoreductase subunit N